MTSYVVTVLSKETRVRSPVVTLLLHVGAVRSSLGNGFFWHEWCSVETAAAESFAYRIVEGIPPLGLGPVSVFLSDGYRHS